MLNGACAVVQLLFLLITVALLDTISIAAGRSTTCCSVHFCLILIARDHIGIFVELTYSTFVVAKTWVL